MGQGLQVIPWANANVQVKLGSLLGGGSTHVRRKTDQCVKLAKAYID